MFSLPQAFTILAFALYFVSAQQRNPPSALPLAVRSPYLNHYLSPTNISESWPMLWDNQHVSGWDLRIAVDGESLLIFGDMAVVGIPVNLTDIVITPTRTVLTVQARTMDVTVTFLSPIEPDDLVLQSFPFTYMYIDVKSNDGQEHSVQLYCDLTGEWLSGDLNSEIHWDTVISDSLMYHHVSRTSPAMSEIANVAEDATLYFAFPNGDDVTYSTSDSPRVQFTANGRLDNKKSTQDRPINNNWPMFAFSRDLGTISSSQESVVWAIGLVRDPSINYMSQERHPYFWTKYNYINDAITEFMSDFKDARDRAVAFDKILQDEARNISEDYADLVSIAARQTLAGAEITVSKTEGGDWNTSDIMSFMKDIGVSRRANPVHIMYTAFPAFLKVNATWAGYLLKPLLLAQNYENSPAYAAPHLGYDYPIITTLSSPPPEGSIESTGDMLIMVLAHAVFSKDASLLYAYYPLLKQWATYLVDKKTNLGGFTDQDGLNNSNLAVKSILGIKCMAAIANATGHTDDSATFTAKAASIYEEWKSKAIMDNHVIAKYGLASSWGLMYNIFYDRLLGLDLIDDSIVTQQDNFYKSKFETEGGQFGIQYDSSRTGQSISTWSMFTAAATLDNDVRDKLVSGVYARATFNGSPTVFPTGYSPQDGTTLFGQASAAQGAVFSLLALNLQRSIPQGGGAIHENTPNSDAPPDDNDKQDGPGAKANHTSAIVGGVVGLLALLALVVISYLLYRRHRRQNINEKLDPYPSAGIGLTPQWHNSIDRSSPTEPLLTGMYSSNEKSRMFSPKTARFVTRQYTGFGGRSPSLPGQHSPNDVLRSDVENLRRELDQIREQAMFVAPPQYDTQLPPAR